MLLQFFLRKKKHAMSAELLPVWNEIEKYIDNGISVIPV